MFKICFHTINFGDISVQKIWAAYRTPLKRNLRHYFWKSDFNFYDIFELLVCVDVISTILTPENLFAYIDKGCEEGQEVMKKIDFVPFLTVNIFKTTHRSIQ
jgi:hypothetical protein